MIFCCKIIEFVHVAQWIERSPPERKAVGSTPIMYIHFTVGSVTAAVFCSIRN